MNANARPPIRMISVVADGVFSPVIDSQIVVPLGLLGTHAPHVQRALLILTSHRHRNNPKVREREDYIRAALPGVHLHFHYRLALGLPLQAWRWARHMAQAIRASGYTGNAPIVVHSRTEGPAAAAAVLKRRDPRIRVLLDLRGASGDEVDQAHKGLIAWHFHRHARRTLTAALRAADAINTVSQKLAQHLRDEEGLSPALPASVIGCCAETSKFFFDPASRAKRRAEFGFADKFVVCYCGSMVPYQRPDVIARTVAGILQRMPEAHFFVVSRDGQVMLDHLARLGVDAGRVTTRAANHDQVASYLMAGDMGLLLRDSTLTNRVASPVKFAEYLRCGLPVLLTPHVGDFSQLVAAEGVGATVAFDGPPEEAAAAAQKIRDRLAGEGDAFRRRCSELAGQRCSWEGQLDGIVRLYEQLSR